MTAPTVVPDLDEQTRDELQPPCDGRDCDRAAAWVIRWRVTCEHVRPVVLSCDPHAQEVRRTDAGVWTCIHCDAYCRLVSVVAL